MAFCRFIHIGLHKTATTYVHSFFLKNNINLIRNEVMPIVNTARQLGRTNKKDVHIKVRLPNEDFVIGNEGLALAYFCGETGNLRKFQQVVVEMIYQVIPKTKILITVREPISWLFSIYNQCIKEGNFYSFPEYLNQAGPVLVESLDIMSLIDIWAKYYEDFLVLPMEMLRDDKHKFFDLIEAFGGIELPHREINFKSASFNPSIPEEKLRIFRKFNELTHLFLTYGASLNDIPRNTLNALEVLRFALRRNLEADYPKLDEKLAEYIRILPSCKIDKEFIDEYIKLSIKNNFKKLFDSIGTFFGYEDLYLKNLS